MYRKDESCGQQRHTQHQFPFCAQQEDRPDQGAVQRKGADCRRGHGTTAPVSPSALRKLAPSTNSAIAATVRKHMATKPPSSPPQIRVPPAANSPPVDSAVATGPVKSLVIVCSGVSHGRLPVVDAVALAIRPSQTASVVARRLTDGFIVTSPRVMAIKDYSGVRRYPPSGVQPCTSVTA